MVLRKIQALLKRLLPFSRPFFPPPVIYRMYIIYTSIYQQQYYVICNKWPKFVMRWFGPAKKVLIASYKAATET